MVEYNTINAKLTNLQLSKSKTAVKNNEGTTLRLGAKNFNKEQLPHELFLTQKQITKLRNSNNNMSTDIKLSKAQIKKIVMSGSDLGSILMRFLPKLIKPATSILKNVAAPLGLLAAMSRIDCAILKKIHRAGTTVKFSNEKMNDMVNVVKASEDSDVLMKGVSEPLNSDVKKLHSKKGDGLPILPMLLGTLGSSLIGNLLTREGLFRAASGKCNCGKGMYRAGEGLFRAAQGTKKKIVNFTREFF